jgi:hypothetical protein
MVGQAMPPITWIPNALLQRLVRSPTQLYKDSLRKDMGEAAMYVFFNYCPAPWCLRGFLNRLFNGIYESKRQCRAALRVPICSLLIIFKRLWMDFVSHAARRLAVIQNGIG